MISNTFSAIFYAILISCLIWFGEWKGTTTLLCVHLIGSDVYAAKDVWAQATEERTLYLESCVGELMAVEAVIFLVALFQWHHFSFRTSLNEVIAPYLHSHLSM